MSVFFTFCIFLSVGIYVLGGLHLVFWFYCSTVVLNWSAGNSITSVQMEHDGMTIKNVLLVCKDGSLKQETLKRTEEAIKRLEQKCEGKKQG